MIKVINFKQYENEQGEKFNSLVLQGGIEFVQSQTTGSFYATARTTSMTSTFDEATCKALIGQELEGNIQKITCDAYDYTIKETGEVVSLTHRYEFVPEGVKQLKEELLETHQVN